MVHTISRSMFSLLPKALALIFSLYIVGGSDNINIAKQIVYRDKITKFD